MTFDEALLQLGVTEEMINDAIVQQGIVEIALTSTEVRPSSIHGNGLFADQWFYKDDWIVPVRLNGVITHLGAASNHGEPNAVLCRWPNGNLYLRATRPIKPDDEILHDYTVCLWCTKEEPTF